MYNTKISNVYLIHVYIKNFVTINFILIYLIYQNAYVNLYNKFCDN